jgi:hypothetical protein
MPQLTKPGVLYRIQFAHVNEDHGTVHWSNHPYAFCSPKAAYKLAGYFDEKYCSDGTRVSPPVPLNVAPLDQDYDVEIPF